MLAPQLRQQIFSLWTAFWSSGMSNPIVAIEQITYLLFLKQLEMQDKKHVDNGKKSLFKSKTDPLRWSELKNAENQYERLTQLIFPWLRTVGQTIKDRWGDTEDAKLEVTEYLADAFFQLPKEKTGTLKTAIDSVNSLFDSTGSQNDDLMGDIFEYLLDQLSTSGKNGQFRTPRHIIRFMIELLAPKEGKRILDPAGGTAGFLTNTVLYHRQKRTSPEQLRLEWDGTPHRLDTSYRPSRDEFTGFDNDRTMVRIGWMNMILHGVSNPRYEQKDPLGKNFNEKELYDYAFANPPYSGNVDKTDLSSRFPRKGARLAGIEETTAQKTTRETANASKEPITDSSELLFVWLLLDLLKPNGKMAVIVPEGLLFGSTIAHKELRRTLIYDHIVEGVISLPQGVFNPYTGVKTSILIVTKGDGTPNDKIGGVEEPKTKAVWFYEVASDGFTLGANRNPQPFRDNDLWDALEKWKNRGNDAKYYRPVIKRQRWRKVDENLTKNFVETKNKFGRVLALQEIFQRLNQKAEDYIDIDELEKNTILESQGILTDLLKRFYIQTPPLELQNFKAIEVSEASAKEFQKKFRNWIIQENRNLGLLEQSERQGSYFEEHGRAVLEQALEEFQKQIKPTLEALTKEELENLLAKEAEATKPKDERIRDNLPYSIAEFLERFAKLDGYNIDLIVSGAELDEKRTLPEPKSWTVEVRNWREQPEWEALSKPAPQPKGKKGKQIQEEQQDTEKIVGSHDAQGNLRPEYAVAALSKDLFLNPDFLESECIEANDFNLSANRYKPLQLTSAAVNAGTTAKQLRELLKMERELQKELETLLKMVEGKA
jgi:type I restriction enzyme M protein